MLNARREIHLVDRGDLMEAGGPEMVINERCKRISLEDHFADIICDSGSRPALFHWVLQRRGCADVVSMGQERSFDAAERAVRWRLGDIVASAKRPMAC